MKNIPINIYINENGTVYDRMTKLPYISKLSNKAYTLNLITPIEKGLSVYANFKRSNNTIFEPLALLSQSNPIEVEINGITELWNVYSVTLPYQVLEISQQNKTNDLFLSFSIADGDENPIILNSQPVKLFVNYTVSSTPPNITNDDLELVSQILTLVNSLASSKLDCDFTTFSNENFENQDTTYFATTKLVNGNVVNYKVPIGNFVNNENITDKLKGITILYSASLPINATNGDIVITNDGDIYRYELLGLEGYNWRLINYGAYKELDILSKIDTINSTLTTINNNLNDNIEKTSNNLNNAYRQGANLVFENLSKSKTISLAALESMEKAFNDSLLTQLIGDNSYFMFNTSSGTKKISFLDLKNILGSSQSLFKGEYVSLQALENAYPVGQIGWYAFVNEVDNPPIMYVWDNDTNEWAGTDMSQFVTQAVFDSFVNGVKDGTIQVGDSLKFNGKTMEYFVDKTTYDENKTETDTAIATVNQSVTTLNNKLNSTIDDLDDSFAEVERQIQENKDNIESNDEDIIALGNDIEANNEQILTIQNKIPSQATTTNKLADKAFVNSSITRMVADKVTSTANGALFTSVAQLQAGPYYIRGEQVTLGLDYKNDYAIVMNETIGTWWYTYDGTQWTETFKVNDKPLTEAQLATLDSGLVANDKTLIENSFKDFTIAYVENGSTITLQMVKNNDSTVQKSIVLQDLIDLKNTPSGSSIEVVTVLPSVETAENNVLYKLNGDLYNKKISVATSGTATIEEE